jgi:transcriptional regulator with XRE-family HTH domain
LKEENTSKSNTFDERISRMKAIAEKLKKLRMDNGFSQEKLAEKLMVSRQAVSKWENGEALPDMENMIALARLYGTSLDELANIAVNNKNIEDNVAKEDADSKVNIDITKDKDNVHINFEGINIRVTDDEDEDRDFDEDDFDDDDDDVHINIGGKIKIDNGKISINDGGIKIDSDGINIDDGRVKIGSSGVIIDDSENEKSGFVKFLYAFPYPIAATIAFFLLGALADAWWIAWILFCTIPVYYSVVTCIHKRRFNPFAYTVFATCIYLFIGMAYSLWHPGWVIFLTIPLYHSIASCIDKAIEKRKKQQ